MICNLTGKNALVCGGSKGIGKAIAIELAKSGASVTLAARSTDLMSQLVQDLDDSQGQQHSFLQVDVHNSKDLIKKVQEGFTDFDAAIEVAQATASNDG